MTHYLKLAVVPAYLLLCLILGGASAAGFWANMVLQLLAIPLIFWAVVVRRGTPMAAPGRQLLVLVALLALLIILQLVPLPPGIWTSLPNRAWIADGYRLLNMPLPWLPISLAPYRTLSSALWLLPALAVLLGVVRLGAFRTSWLSWAIILVAAASVMVGALQIVGDSSTSPWYFYTITNRGQTTGFFANSNHMATLLLVTLPFLAALYVSARNRRRSAQRASGLLVIVLGATAVILVGLVINHSLAGIGLALPVALSSAFMIWSRKRSVPKWAWAAVLLLIVGGVVLASKAPFSSLQVKEAQEGTSLRAASFKLGAKAAHDYFPVGSGIGSFNEVYPTYEDPSTVSRFYMNHVHNDYIEMVMETGVFGIALLLLFLAWWAWRVIQIWRSDDPDYFARAATIASAAILAHSIVDYPLRTAAVSAVFALCCGLMAEPRSRVKAASTSDAPAAKARHLSVD